MKTMIEKSSGKSDWKGYTMEELYYRRATIYARKEIEKYRLTLAVDSMKQSTPMLGGQNGLMGKASGVMSFVEYGVIAFRVIRKILPLFRRKKK